jgi:hypothetical protein
MKALADIVNDENWCAGALALDAEGFQVKPSDRAAVKLCMMGWLSRKYNISSFHTKAFFDAVTRVKEVCIKKYRSGDITAINDMLVKDAAEVAAIFAEARV